MLEEQAKKEEIEKQQRRIEEQKAQEQQQENENENYIDMESDSVQNKNQSPSNSEVSYDRIIPTRFSSSQPTIAPQTDVENRRDLYHSRLSEVIPRISDIFSDLAVPEGVLDDQLEFDDDQNMDFPIEDDTYKFNINRKTTISNHSDDNDGYGDVDNFNYEDNEEMAQEYNFDNHDFSNPSTLLSIPTPLKKYVILIH